MDERPILTGGFPQTGDGLSIAGLRSSVIIDPAVFPCHLALTFFWWGLPHAAEKRRFLPLLTD
jgi:hypothetical protein